ncbi:bifunctional nicotinamidase/pyrazinamidase [Echinicola jeungdonensis]|uniref:bifunctional nicotinamidase/pyrazinamidase n=1 Tax=Echinicola jeungdonensis TaxID=709343 RepID=UPI00338F31E6
MKDGDKIIPIINKLQSKFDFIVGTQDWHPENHLSFAANHKGKKPGEIIKLDGMDQILWPVHCVKESHGSQFHPYLKTEGWKKVFKKGTNPKIDSYSGFFDNHKRQDTGLGKYLKENGVDTVYVVGLAADYCVKFTVLDAVSEGFKTYLVKDGTRAVNLEPNDFEKAIKDMEEAGAQMVKSEDLI